MTWQLIETADTAHRLSHVVGQNGTWPRAAYTMTYSGAAGKVSFRMEYQAREDCRVDLVRGWDHSPDMLPLFFQFVARAQAKWGEDLPLTLFNSTFGNGTVGDLWTHVEEMLDGGNEVLGSYWEVRHPEHRRLVQPFHPSWSASEYADAVVGDRLTEWEKTVRRGMQLSYSPAEITNTVIQVWSQRNAVGLR